MVELVDEYAVKRMKHRGWLAGHHHQPSGDPQETALDCANTIKTATINQNNSMFHYIYVGITVDNLAVKTVVFVGL